MTEKHKKSEKKSAEENGWVKKDIKDVEEQIVVEQEGRIVELGKKVEEYLDGWRRCQAEFENYRRVQGDAQRDLVKYATQNLILELIPVLDNFRSATEHVPEEQKESAWVTGIMHIRKQLEQVLESGGLEEIAVKEGDNFDPAVHEAVEDKECVHCQADKKYRNRIKRVAQGGYRMGERVIRPARVVVE